MTGTLKKLAVALAITVGLSHAAHADRLPGKAVVRDLQGQGTYTDVSGVEKPLKVGVVLREGYTVKTAKDSWLDLLLPQNGPNVGLGPESTLKLTTLQYEETELGVVKQTVLDVSQGEIYGHVSKLIGDSKYLVRSPKGIAEVKGTDFWYDTKFGDIHVLSGQVFLTVIMDATFGGSPSSESFAKAITVNAGQSFYMPRGQLKGAVLSPVSTPPGLVIRPWFVHYTSPSATGVLTTKYDTTLQVDPRTQVTRAYVEFPPSIVTVSP